jgi:hypothetical protein
VQSCAIYRIFVTINQGCLKVQAEIILFEPDPGNAGVGKNHSGLIRSFIDQCIHGCIVFNLIGYESKRINTSDPFMGLFDCREPDEPGSPYRAGHAPG